MEDFEKNRTEYVQRLEISLQNALKDVAKFKPLAENWTPEVSSRISSEDEVQIVLKFGGKLQTVTIKISELLNTSNKDIVSEVAFASAYKFAETLFVEMIRSKIEPHIEKLKLSAKVVSTTNNW